MQDWVRRDVLHWLWAIPFYRSRGAVATVALLPGVGWAWALDTIPGHMHLCFAGSGCEVCLLFELSPKIYS